MNSSFIHQLGGRVVSFSTYLGGLSMLAWRVLGLAAKGRLSPRLIGEQIYYLAYKSLSLTNLVAIFTGMVLALQFVVGLKRFGLQLYAGQVVGIAIVRELGPVLTSLMIAARVGSGIAAEIGSMTVTEQVAAIEAMGANPIVKLVIPRVLVTAFLTPLLTIIADVIGILGGMLITVIEAGVTAHFYLDQILRTIKIQDFLSGVGKTFFFGFVIGLIACYQGLKTTRGTQGVGQATTRSVVYSSMSIFVLDYFLTKIFLLF